MSAESVSENALGGESAEPALSDNRDRQPPMNAEHSLRYDGWRVAAAAAITLSFAAYVPYAFPIFLKPVSDEFSWSREATSSAFGIYSAMTALCATPIGYFADRLGPTRIIPLFLALFGVTFGSLAALTADVRHLYAVFAVLGIAVTGMLPIAFARAVCSWFVRRRGLALALAISGGSIGGLVWPPAVQALIGTLGWRTACLALSAIVLLVGVPVAHRFIRERPVSRFEAASSAVGATVRDGLSSRVFWTVTVVFFCSTLIQYGAVVHLSALLTDRGVSPARAALAVSAFGGASLLGRLVTGSLLDRFFAARVACALMVTASLGTFLLAGAQSFAIGATAAFLIGFGTAGESDVVPYLLSRYFGLRSCSTLFGIAWMATALGAAAGPMLMGRAFDSTGSYEVLLLGVGVLVLASSTLMLTMPRYPQVQAVQTATTV
jgi:MFS family permease